MRPYDPRVIQTHADPGQALPVIKQVLEHFLTFRQEEGENMLNDGMTRQHTHVIKILEEEIRKICRPQAGRKERDLTVPVSLRMGAASAPPLGQSRSI